YRQTAPREISGSARACARALKAGRTRLASRLTAAHREKIGRTVVTGFGKPTSLVSSRKRGLGRVVPGDAGNECRAGSGCNEGARGRMVSSDTAGLEGRT